jgi:hypothetical protein
MSIKRQKLRGEILCDAQVGSRGKKEERVREEEMEAERAGNI